LVDATTLDEDKVGAVAVVDAITIEFKAKAAVDVIKTDEEESANLDGDATAVLVVDSRMSKDDDLVTADVNVAAVVLVVDSRMGKDDDLVTADVNDATTAFVDDPRMSEDDDLIAADVVDATIDLFDDSTISEHSEAIAIAVTDVSGTKFANGLLLRIKAAT
jgi:hypothetical protein